MTRRLAIVATHPIQYYAPWFRFLSELVDPEIMVFYLDQPAQRGGMDPQFGQQVLWDVPLLEGYAFQFVPNTSRRPGSDHYGGLRNPALWERVRTFRPHATLLMAYHYASLLPALLLGKLPGPVFLRGDSHLLGRSSGPRRWLADQVIRRAFSRLQGALYAGTLSQEYFLHHGLAPENLFCSPPAVDMALYAPSPKVRKDAALWRSDLGVPSTHRLIGFVGKFIREKRPMDLVRAFLDAALPETSLVFVGDGPLRDDLVQAAAGHDQIYFSPLQNQSRMPRTYAALDLLVLPSASETWGLAVNECFAMGVPALVSDRVGCAPDLVHGHDTGAVFPAGDARQLVLALQQATGDSERLAQWGRKAGSLVRERFSYAAMTRGVFQAMDQVAA